MLIVNGKKFTNVTLCIPQLKLEVPSKLNMSRKNGIN